MKMIKRCFRTPFSRLASPQSSSLPSFSHHHATTLHTPLLLLFRCVLKSESKKPCTHGAAGVPSGVSSRADVLFRPRKVLLRFRARRAAMAAGMSSCVDDRRSSGGSEGPWGVDLYCKGVGVFRPVCRKGKRYEKGRNLSNSTTANRLRGFSWCVCIYIYAKVIGVFMKFQELSPARKTPIKPHEPLPKSKSQEL